MVPRWLPSRNGHIANTDWMMRIKLNPRFKSNLNSSFGTTLYDSFPNMSSSRPLSGLATSTVANVTVVVRHLNSTAFATWLTGQGVTLSAPFDQCGSDEICNAVVFEAFASYLAYGYTITSGKEKGKHYAPQTCENYFSSALQHGWSLFANRDDAVAKAFFKYQWDPDVKCLQRSWCLKTKRIMVKDIFVERTAAGEAPGASYERVYYQDIINVAAAYAAEGSPKAATRAVKPLTAWLGSGRPNETGAISLEEACWDKDLKQLFVKLPQKKTSRMKDVCIMASPNRHGDFFYLYGAALTIAPSAAVDEDGNHWLLPGSTPMTGVQLTKILRDVADKEPGAPRTQFDDVFVEGLSPSITGRGIRKVSLFFIRSYDLILY